MTVPQFVIDLEAEGRIVFHGAHRIETDNPASPACAWSGYEDLVIGGETYIGIGAVELMQPATYSLGTASEGMEVRLSSMNADFVPLVKAQQFRGRLIEVFEMYWDEHGTTLLHMERVLLGTLDQMPTSRTPGGEGVVTFKIESEAHGSQRTGDRLASDPSQRQIDPNDRSMEYVTIAPDIVLRWGQEGDDRAGKVANGGNSDQSSRR